MGVQTVVNGDSLFCDPASVQPGLEKRVKLSGTCELAVAGDAKQIVTVWEWVGHYVHHQQQTSCLSTKLSLPPSIWPQRAPGGELNDVFDEGWHSQARV